MEKAVSYINWKATDREVTDIASVYEGAQNVADMFKEPVFIYRDLTIQREYLALKQRDYLIVDTVYPSR
jgi:hypothetical protein